MLIEDDLCSKYTTTEEDQESNSDSVSQKMARDSLAEETLPILSLVMTGKFFWLYVIVVSHMFYCYYISNQFKQYGFTGGLDDQTLTTIGAAGALFNGCFKVVWATLLDYYNFKPVFSVIICIVMLCLATIHWAVYN